MKILMYSQRDYELKSVETWAKANGAQVDGVEEGFNADTVGLSKGYDAVCIQQVAPAKDEVIFKTLKENNIPIISSRTAGVDMIDHKTARDYGIDVTNVPKYSPNAIGEYAVTLALNVLRNVQPALKKAKDNCDFTWAKQILGKEIRMQKIGIIGTGFIGFTAAKIFKGFGAEVIAYDKFPRKDTEGVLTYKDSVEEVLKEADLISLHLPLLPDVENLINKDTIKLMKDGAIIINTGRGGLINTADLIEALESGKLAGAGLDVLDDEMGYMNRVVTPEDIKDTNMVKLAKFDNVIVTYHLAFFTETAVDNIVVTSLDNIKNALNGSGEVFVVNK